MQLGGLKMYIESFPEGTVFNYSLSDPFSWRGVYAEVAFSIERTTSTREELLIKIEKALTNTFYGYKGGEYQFDNHTTVNFEENRGSWSDGGYVNALIEEVTEEKEYMTPEEKLTRLIFK